MKKALFAFKSEWKIEHFKRLARPPATAGGKEHIVSRYDNSYTPSTYLRRKVIKDSYALAEQI